MSNHHDCAAWDNKTPEEQQKYMARANAEELRRKQKQNDNLIKWINEQLEKMDFEQLKMMYDVSYDVEKFKTFFEVLRNLK